MTKQQQALDLIVIFAVAVGFLWLAWVGFIASDDDTYRATALALLNPDQPLPIHSHWALRYTIVAPVSLSIALFGDHEFSLILPSLTYFFSLILISYFFLSRFAGRHAALIGTLLVSSHAFFTVEFTRVVSETAELPFLVSSLCLFFAATQVKEERRKLGLLIGGGLALGLAWLTRETAVQLVLFYSLLFLMGYGIKRKYYWVMAGAFLAVLAVEMIAYTYATGDPFHRLVVDLTHGDRGGGVDRFLDRGDGTLSREGNIQIHWLLDPIITLLINEEFGLTYWIFIGILTQRMRIKASLSEQSMQLFDFLSMVVLANIAFMYLSIPVLNLLPRYFMLSTYGILGLIALSAIPLFRQHRKITSVLLIAYAGLNILGILVENKQPLAVERILVTKLEDMDQTLHVSPKVENNMGTLLYWNQVDSGRITSACPGHGDIFLFHPFSDDHFKGWIRDDFQTMATVETPQPLYRKFIQQLPFLESLPPSIYLRLTKPVADAKIYLIPNNIDLIPQMTCNQHRDP